MVDKEHDREPKTWIGFAKTQMTTFSFFFDLQLGYSFYAITADLQEALQEKKMSAILGQPIARVISKTEAVQNGESFVKRKPVKAKYSTLQHIGDCNKGGTHHSKTGKYQFWQIHFEATDYYVPSLKQRFDQPL